MLKVQAVCVVLGVVATASVAGAAPQCLSYEPTTVELQGRLVAKVFPGPPSYQDVKCGDTPEKVWLLDLLDPICVTAKPADRSYPAASDTRQVQLVLDPGQYSQYKDLVGREVVVSGRLFAAHTGHHRTPVLIAVGALKPASRG